MAIDPVTAGLFEAVAATPDKASAWIDLGSDIQRNGDAELVVSLFRRALVLDPSSLEAAASLAFACAAAFRPHDGRTILMGRRLIDFRAQYALAWCSLPCGEVDGLLQFIDDARHNAGGRYVSTWPSYRDIAVRLLKLRACRPGPSPLRGPGAFYWQVFRYGRLRNCAPTTACPSSRLGACRDRYFRNASSPCPYSTRDNWIYYRGAAYGLPQGDNTYVFDRGWRINTNRGWVRLEPYLQSLGSSSRILRANSPLSEQSLRQASSQLGRAPAR